ncbi:glycosyltransferase [Pseudobacteriovorax antillogorgiicola]|uniref:Glycosyltransferase involved in cell wall bisynthesis n=1 Tax=Pseudobacteriovorax antillogorgiicola TaxID=1513793 RepID=A0A1Y6BJ69_9BACT|nr:glycosyltransferase [Pseudobacteriovorax antillogorgiicola]TCS55392.1 glycosyltransferase involved in cell wall biosynthesis [Pseudobacteriovorax antillogorgiicola]SMF13110.1 Glycosyltransferase involved in cell wall bisynthesis [Pseudobacteriovorax antillogorgiicola]
MTRVLIITASRVQPALTGGHQRTLQFARSLVKAGVDSRILSMAGRRADYGRQGIVKIPRQEDQVEEWVDLNFISGGLQFVMNCLGASRLWTQLPWPTSSVVEECLQWADILVFDFPFYNLSRFPAHLPKIMLSHNIEADLLKQGHILERRVLRPVVEGAELRAARGFDHIFACAPSDRDYYRFVGGEVTEIPNGMARLDLTWSDYQKARSELEVEENEFVLLFVGSRFGPNIDGLNELKSQLESYRRLCLEWNVKLKVVGSVSHPFQDDFVEGHGFVDSLETYLAAADVVVNPVNRGSGSNIKVFQALAAGKPLLSTPFGVRGLPGISHPGLKIYRSGRDILDAVSTWRHDQRSLFTSGQELRDRLGSAILMDGIVKERALPVITSLV